MNWSNVVSLFRCRISDAVWIWKLSKIHSIFCIQKFTRDEIELSGRKFSWTELNQIVWIILQDVNSNRQNKQKVRSIIFWNKVWLGFWDSKPIPKMDLRINTGLKLHSKFIFGSILKLNGTICIFIVLWQRIVGLNCDLFGFCSMFLIFLNRLKIEEIDKRCLLTVAIN